MNNNIKIAQYAPFLEFQKGYTPDFVHDAIKKNNLEGLHIVDHLNPIESLKFLKEFTFLNKLYISCVEDHDYSFLGNLVQLKELNIQQSRQNNKEINLSSLSELKKLTLHWRKSVKGLTHCVNIEELGMLDFKEKNLIVINKLKNLQKLIIKVASIEVLNGVEDLKLLEFLHLGSCAKLKNIKALDGLTNLKKLEFEKCKKIEDLDKLLNLPNLDTLRLINCGKIQSIKFIKNFPLLKHFSLIGDTEVIDGDMKPAKDIEDVVYVHKKYYNIKIANKKHDELMKKNRAKIKEIEQRYAN